MKTSFIFFFMVCVCRVQAQVKTIKSPSGNVLAYECANGDIKSANVQPVLIISDTLGVVDTVLNENIEIINAGSTVLVDMQDSLTIIDGTGAIVANYNPVSKELKDTNNDLIFFIDAGGYVKDEMDVVVGRVDEWGNVYGSDLNLIAEAPGIMAFKLAYLFFYSNK